jgi:long-chain acyl-CoA synthetase
MTPTLKLKRSNLMAHFAQEIEGMYQKPAGR